MGSAAQAERDAAAAAEHAGVEVRSLHSHDELSDARAIWDLTWPSTLEGTQMTPNLLRALEHAGGYVSGAYDGERMVGSAVALLARVRRGEQWHTHLHSHMAAAVPGYGDRGVGTALKTHQRAWALAHGLDTVVWTFDPLVRRNARLNLVKLGTTAAEYLPDFYGDMPDEVNHGDPSDRLLVAWDLGSERVTQALAGATDVPSSADLVAAGAAVGLAVDAAGTPVATGERAAVTLVAVPEDIVALRRTDPRVASTWRVAVREGLVPLLSGGGVVTGLTRDGYYVVQTMQTLQTVRAVRTP